MTPPSPSRRSVLQTVGGVFLGAGAYLKRPRWPGFFGGTIEACPVDPHLEPDDELPPDEYVTPLADDRLADLAPLQEALERPCEEVALSRREFGNAATALKDIPMFHPYRHGDDVHSDLLPGIYVRDSDYTYWIELSASCEDAWWIETERRSSGDGWYTC